MSNELPPQRHVIIRPLAVADIEQHSVYLSENAAPDVAQRFRTAVMDAVAQVAPFPTAGALRKANNAHLAGLRMTIVSGFRNYLIFYLTPDDQVEIIRVLHGAQEIGNILEREQQ